MNLLNAILTAIFGALLAPVASWPPWLVLVVVSALAGVGMAWAASGALASLLYEVSATDASVLAAAAAGLALVAGIGAGVPAMRASRVEPVVALRGE